MTIENFLEWVDDAKDEIRSRMNAWTKQWKAEHEDETIESDLVAESTVQTFDALVQSWMRIATVHGCCPVFAVLEEGICQSSQRAATLGPCEKAANEFRNDVFRELLRGAFVSNINSVSSEDRPIIEGSPVFFMVDGESQIKKRATKEIIKGVIGELAIPRTNKYFLEFCTTDEQRKRMCGMRTQLVRELESDIDEILSLAHWPIACHKDFDGFVVAMWERMCSTLTDTPLDGSSQEQAEVREVVSSFLKKKLATIFYEVSFLFPAIGTPGDIDVEKHPFYGTLSDSKRAAEKKEADLERTTLPNEENNDTTEQNAALLFSSEFLSHWWNRTWDDFMQRNSERNIPKNGSSEWRRRLKESMQEVHSGVSQRIKLVDSDGSLDNAERFDLFVDSIRVLIDDLPNSMEVGKHDVCLPRDDWRQYFEHRIGELSSHLVPLFPDAVDDELADADEDDLGEDAAAEPSAESVLAALQDQLSQSSTIDDGLAVEVVRVQSLVDKYREREQVLLSRMTGDPKDAAIAAQELLALRQQVAEAAGVMGGIVQSIFPKVSND